MLLNAHTRTILLFILNEIMWFFASSPDLLEDLHESDLMLQIQRDQWLCYPIRLLLYLPKHDSLVLLLLKFIRVLVESLQRTITRYLLQGICTRFELDYLCV